MVEAYRDISTRVTPQSEPIIGRTDMEKNNAGGFGWSVDDWGRLDRFLILGSESSTYYTGQRDLTKENVEAILRCLAADGARAVARVEEMSLAGRAPKNDPALLVLAIAVAKGNAATKAAVERALPRVARTGTHILHFAEYAQSFRGWGRSLRSAVGGWYTTHAPEALAYQVAKYQQRDGWSHRDLLRLTHPKAPTSLHADVFNWVCDGWPGVGDEPHPEQALRILWALERAKRATEAAEIVRLIADHGLTREMIPTQFLTSADVWAALLVDMPMTAMIRNLATMTRVGLVAPGSQSAGLVVSRVGDAERLRRARVHPIAILSALRTYQSGKSVRGASTWEPVTSIVDGLNDAFYAAFPFVPTTGKRWLLALDVSGSMGGGVVAGVPGLTPREATAALALVTAATEPNYHIVAFSSAGVSGWPKKPKGTSSVSNDGISPLDISPKQRLTDAIKAVADLPFGGTDCALPMRYAAERKLDVDAFVILTDSETWAGTIQPVQALVQYRQRRSIDAKCIVVGMTSAGFTIADPKDAGMLDVVGFDAAVPALMADFVTSGMVAAGVADETF